MKGHKIRKKERREENNMEETKRDIKKETRGNIMRRKAGRKK
jgi:hypothetical protein